MTHVTYQELLVRTPRESDLMSAETLSQHFAFRLVSPLHTTADPMAVISSLTRLFSDISVLQRVAEVSIFRGRTNAVFTHGRDYFDVFQRSVEAYKELTNQPSLGSGLKTQAAAEIVAGAVLHAAGLYGVLAAPALPLFGERGIIPHQDASGRTGVAGDLVVLDVQDMQRAVIESLLLDVAVNLPKSGAGGDASALPVDRFSAHLRSMSQGLTVTLSGIAQQAEVIAQAASHAKWVMLNGAPESVDISSLSRLIELVNIGIERDLTPIEPSRNDLQLLKPLLVEAMSALTTHPSLRMIPASQFPSYYRRYQAKIARTDRYAPVVVMRNYPQSEPGGTQLAIRTYSRAFGVHQLSTLIKRDISVDQDISLVGDTLLIDALHLLAERRDFTGLVAPINGRELKALALCLCMSVEYTPPSTAGRDADVTYHFRGPRLNQQLASVIDDDILASNSTTVHSLVVAYAEYANWGRETYPTTTSVSEILSATQAGAITVLAPSDWRPATVDAGVEMDVQGYFVKELPYTNMEEGETEEPSRRPIRYREEEVAITGKVSLNSAIRFTSTYPTSALRTVWARQIEFARAQMMLGVYAVLTGDTDTFRESGLVVYAFDEDGTPIGVDDGVDFLVTGWRGELTEASIRAAFFENFQGTTLQALASPSVRAATAYLHRTGRGRDRAPLTHAEAAAYVKTRIAVLKSLALLLYGADHPATRLANLVFSEEEMVEWLTNRILLQSRHSL